MGSLLETITDPKDIKNLNWDELRELAADIRSFMVESVAKTGGHLASSLGVVDLIIALCVTYDFPKDKIIFDVGHQSYAYKILTGRKDKFDTLRQWQGLSGFPKREESEYDSFNTGHSSTSLSAALGMAEARDLKGEDCEIIAVIGDGALTGGMAYEALNNAGSSRKNITFILNDNEMSISRNVGAMANYLSRARTSPKYSRDKQRLNKLFKLNSFSAWLGRVLVKLKNGLKYFMVTDSGIIFEEMGFTYLGPVDGHDIERMCQLLVSSRNINGPVLIHVVTKKGKGFGPAEANPNGFHGVGMFDPKTGEMPKKSNLPSFSACFGKHLVAEADKDERICAVTAAMPDGTGLTAFAEKFPKRFFDVGIAEQHAVTFSGGLAANGMKPVCAIYSSFIQRGIDQVFHDICLQNLPVIFGLDRAGAVGEDGETHQGLFDISMIRPLPNVTMMAPSTDKEIGEMLHLALTLNSPVVLRYPRGNVSGWDAEFAHAPLELGKGEIVAKGADVLLIPLGNMLDEALKAAMILEKNDISAEIINPRFIKPLDEDLLSKEMVKFNHVITIEDHTVTGGFGSAVLEFSEEIAFNGKIHRLGYPDELIKQGKTSILREHYGLDGASIAAYAAKILTEK